MDNIRKFKNGLKIEPKTPLTADTQGELEVNSSDGKLNYHNGSTESPVVTEAHSATLTNKTLTSPIINTPDINGATLSLNDSDSAFNLEVQSTSTLTSDKTLTIDVNDANRTLTIAADATISGTSSGTNTGDVTLTAVGASPNANAASLSGQALTLQPADGTNPGVLTAGAQTIGGAKTFSSTVTVANLIDSGLTADTVPYADATKQLVSSAVTPTELGYLSGVTSSIQTQIGTKVTGPASATDEALVRFDGTTGKLVQNSVITATDAGIMSGITQLNVDNLRLDGNTISSTDTNGNVVVDPNGTGDILLTLSGVGAQLQLGSSNFVTDDSGSVDIIGDLDVDNININGNTIQSTNANGNISLDPNGTGTIEAAASVNVVGSLRSDTSLILEETGAGTDTITIQAPASIAASYTLTLPVDDGNSGEILSTNGSGVTSWVSNSASAYATVKDTDSTANPAALNTGTTANTWFAPNNALTIQVTAGTWILKFRCLEQFEQSGANFLSTIIQFATSTTAGSGLIGEPMGGMGVGFVSGQPISQGLYMESSPIVFGSTTDIYVHFKWFSISGTPASTSLTWRGSNATTVLEAIKVSN